MRKFESFNSQYGEVEISYEDGKIILADKEDKFGPAEAELIMQEYIDFLGENGEVQEAYQYVKGFWASKVN